MTHYLVKHAQGDYRLHTGDGTEPTGTVFSNRPDTNVLANDIAAAGPGGSLLGDNSHYIRICLKLVATGN